MFSTENRMVVEGRYQFRSLESRHAYRNSCESNRFNYEMMKDGFRVFHTDGDDNVIAICSIDDVLGERPYYRNDGTVYINNVESVHFYRIHE